MKLSTIKSDLLAILKSPFDIEDFSIGLFGGLAAALGIPFILLGLVKIIVSIINNPFVALFILWFIFCVVIVSKFIGWYFRRQFPSLYK